MNPSDVKQVGKWRVVGLIGQGGMSWVFQVLDPRLNAVRALKMLKPAAASAAGYKGFLREAQILASIDDDFLVRIYDLDKDPETGNDYYVMELLSGSDLKQFLKSHGPLETERARTIFGGALQALGRLHTQSPPIIHRDIKPGNIQITESGRPKLLDLGIAKVTRKSTEETVFGDDSTVADMFKGTVLYASPEQLAMQESGPQSDVFAMGLCIYEALEGRHAYAGIEGLPDPTNSHVLYQDVFRFYTRLEAVQGKLKVEFKRTPKPLQAVIRKALEIEPRLRFRDANEMRAALLDPELVRPRPTVEEVVRPRQETKQRAEPKKKPEGERVEVTRGPEPGASRRWMTALVGLAVAACLGGGLYLLWPRLTPRPGPEPAQIATTNPAENAADDAHSSAATRSESSPAEDSGAPKEAAPETGNEQEAKLAFLAADELNAKTNAPEDYERGVASQAEGHWDEANQAFVQAREKSLGLIDGAEQWQATATAARQRIPGDCAAAVGGVGPCRSGEAALAEGARALEELRASDATAAFRAASSAFAEAEEMPIALRVDPNGRITLEAGVAQRFVATTDPPGAKVMFLVRPPGGVKPYPVMGNPYAFVQKQPGQYQITVSASDSQKRQAKPVEILVTVRPEVVPEKHPTAVTADVQVPSQTAVAPAPVVDDPLAEARTLLQRFRAAIEGRDMNRLRMVWKIDPESAEGFQHLFDNADDITVVADPIGPIQPKGGDKAELRFRQRVTTTIGGETQDIVPLAPYRAELLRRAGGWQIIGLRQD